MRFTLLGLWPLKMSLGMVAAIGLAAHFLIVTYHSIGISLQVVKVLSDIAWLQLLLGCGTALGAVIWRVWREKKVDLLLLASSLVLLVMVVFIAFSWTLETEVPR